MAKDSDPLADAFGDKETGGLFSGLLAEETSFDSRMMWRLGSWGVAAVGAVVVAVMSNQAQLGWRRDQVASVDLSRQAERLQLLTRESQNEARRLASAIETLNTDRDRLYSRVTVLEQGLDSVTGAIARQTVKPQDTPSPDAQTTPPSVAPVASMPAPSNDKPRTSSAKEQARDTVKEAAKELPGPQTAAAASLVQQATSAPPAAPLLPSRPMVSQPDLPISKSVQSEAPEKNAEPAPAPTEMAAAKSADPAETETPSIAVQQTRFAIDLGSANSLDGLRALWRGVSRSNPEIAALRPVIMIKESTGGLGMQLRLGAGPLMNAAAAARLCAVLAENDRHCETTVFDGQRLSLRGQDKGQEKTQDRVQDKDAAPQADTAPTVAPTAKPEKPRRGSAAKRSSKREEPAPAPPPQAASPKPEAAATGSTLSSFFRR